MKLGPALPLISLLAVAGCTRPAEKAPAATSPATPASPKQTHRAETEDSCVDGWLTAHKLDSFGNPDGSDYRHGTPLIDEVDGQAINRFDYVYAHHPEAKQACSHLRQPAPGTR